VRSHYAEAELDDIEAQRRFSLLKLFVDRTDRVALRCVGSSGLLETTGMQRVIGVFAITAKPTVPHLGMC
jgi:hypothetical protein